MSWDEPSTWNGSSWRDVEPKYCKICGKLIRIGANIRYSYGPHYKGLNHLRCANKQISIEKMEIEQRLADRRKKAYDNRMLPIPRGDDRALIKVQDILGIEELKAHYVTKDHYFISGYDSAHKIKILNDDRFIFYKKKTWETDEINHQASYWAQKEIIGAVIVCTEEEWMRIQEKGTLALPKVKEKKYKVKRYEKIKVINPEKCAEFKGTPQKPPKVIYRELSLREILHDRLVKRGVIAE
jgi:hypothetical protein